MNNFDKKFDEEIKKLVAEEKIDVPKNVQDRVSQTLSFLENTQTKKKKKHIFVRIGAVAAAVVILMVCIMPNLSSSYAEAASKIPIIGSVIKVMTIRNYSYVDDNHEMKVEVPSVVDGENSNAADNINKDVDELTKRLVNEFYAELEEYEGANHSSLYTTYEVVTNTERWFTLRLSVHTVAGTGYTYFKNYHIDRASNKIVELKDLFKDESYNKIITDNIKEQMKEQMAEDDDIVYWIDAKNPAYEFASVSDNHNFYFKENGDIVIQFDKLEVGPSSVGCPDFTISKSLFKDILKDEFKNDIP